MNFTLQVLNPTFFFFCPFIKTDYQRSAITSELILIHLNNRNEVLAMIKTILLVWSDFKSNHSKFPMGVISCLYLFGDIV